MNNTVWSPCNSVNACPFITDHVTLSNRHQSLVGICIMSMTAVLFTPHPHTHWYVMYHVHDSCYFYPPPTYTLVCYVSCPWQLFFLPPSHIHTGMLYIMPMTAVLFTPPPPPPHWYVMCHVHDSCSFYTPPTYTNLVRIMSMTAVLFTPLPHTPIWYVLCPMTAVLFTPHPHRPWYIMSMTLTVVLFTPPPPPPPLLCYVSCQWQLFQSYSLVGIMSMMDIHIQVLIILMAATMPMTSVAFQSTCGVVSCPRRKKYPWTVLIFLNGGGRGWRGGGTKREDRGQSGCNNNKNTNPITDVPWTAHFCDECFQSKWQQEVNYQQVHQ